MAGTPGACSHVLPPELAACRHDPGQTGRVLNHLNHNHHKCHTGSDRFVIFGFCVASTWMRLASDPPREESRCDGGSDGSARGGDTSNGASLQHWRRPPTTALRGVGGLSSTTPHGDRRPPVQWRASTGGAAGTSA